MSTATLDVRSISRLFKALADQTRLRIVALLAHGELCVCHVEHALRLSQPNASRHLATLRAAGIVDTRRYRNWVYYRLAPQADPSCARHLRTLVKAFAREDGVRRDVERLIKEKGPRPCP